MGRDLLLAVDSGTQSMRAMLFEGKGKPLRLAHVPDPTPGPGQLLVRVRACAVCRTDLHVVDGELEHPKLPLVPGHEIVGHVVAKGPGVAGFEAGTRVGIPWLGWTDGTCKFCTMGRRRRCCWWDSTECPSVLRTARTRAS